MEIRKINMEQFLNAQDRYILVRGNSEGAPLCPYGNHYEWIGYDKDLKQYVRFTKSVFKLLISHHLSTH